MCLCAYRCIRILQYEVSNACPPGWIFYKDDGTEGYDSCVHVSTATAASWNAANSSCSALGSGAHLLTINSAFTASRLLAFASSLHNFGGSFAYIGCFQLSNATQRGRDWYWVDNTDNSNLNCGTGAGAEGCNLWNTGEPNDSGSTSGQLNPLVSCCTAGYPSFGPIDFFFTSACARRTGAASQVFECMHNTLTHRVKT